MAPNIRVAAAVSRGDSVGEFRPVMK